MPPGSCVRVCCLGSFDTADARVGPGAALMLMWPSHARVRTCGSFGADAALL